MGTNVLVAHQPAYLPWGGYFSRLIDIDRMVILDHVQFTKGGYQNRNRVIDHAGRPHWITVPIRHRFGQRLLDVHTADPRWGERHWRTLTHAYGKARYWTRYADQIAEVFLHPGQLLVDVDLTLTRILLDALGLDVELVRSSTIRPCGARTDMLIDLCRRTTCDVLRVGTGALSYLDMPALNEAEIGLQIATFAPSSRRDAGQPAASVVDLLFHHGPEARDLLNAGSLISEARPT